MSITDPMHTASQADEGLLREIERLNAKLAAVRERISRVIFGQQDVIDQTLVTLLAGGHALLIGVPGLSLSWHREGR